MKTCQKQKTMMKAKHPHKTQQLALCLTTLQQTKEAQTMTVDNTNKQVQNTNKQPCNQYPIINSQSTSVLPQMEKVSEYNEQTTKVQ